MSRSLHRRSSYSIRRFVFGLVLLALSTVTLLHAQRGDMSVFQTISTAEEARGRSAEGLQPIVNGLQNPSSAVRAFAVRALGRQELVAMAPKALALLQDSSPKVRAEAANAVAQCYFTASAGTDITVASSALSTALAGEKDPEVKGAIARSYARLPFANGAAADKAADEIAASISAVSPKAYVVAAAAALESLYRIQKGRVTSAVAIPVMKSIAMGKVSVAPARARTLALMALTVAGAADDDVLQSTVKDPDEQVRRITAVASGSADGLKRLLLTPVRDPVSDPVRKTLIATLLRDPVPMVRLEALQAYTTHGQGDSCKPIFVATSDSGVHVPLLALDLLAKPCSSSERDEQISILKKVSASLPAVPEEGVGKPTWHKPAHAIVSLGSLDAAAASQLLPQFLASPSWEARMYAAKAAAAMGDAATLTKLLDDSNANVVAASVTGLAKTKGRSADDLIAAKATRLDNQVGVAVGRALLESKTPGIAPVVLKALAGYTAKGIDNTRDARVALLKALKTLGSADNADATKPYLVDFDPAVANAAAADLKAWGIVATAAPRRPLTAAPNLAKVFALKNSHMVITMKRGDSFEIELYPQQAPATVERMVGLAEKGYFNGLTLQRWAPNWVVQGGGKGANELVGDSPFMNDEVGLLPHDRGALGISTRGHDTGDAQLFVDLNENDRLDFGYTVWGHVVRGMHTVDTVMEADVMAKVEIVPVAKSVKKQTK